MKMKAKSSSTAILLFARSTESEVHEKWLPKGTEIYPLLNKRARTLAEESGLPLFHSTEKDQVGADFGSRFGHAIQEIFDAGYTSVISIGNDTPQLTQNDIQIAVKQIKAGNSVIGPSADGGIYLLGIHATDFDRTTFGQLKWCTSQVRSSIAAYLRSSGKKLKILRQYRDLDSASDYSVLLNTQGIIPFGILEIMRAALKRVLQWFDPPEIFTLQPLWQPHLNKGSPQ